MATYQKYHQAIEEIFHGTHDFSSHTFKYALTNTAPNTGTHTGLADIAEISPGNGYNAGGSQVTITSATQTAGTLSVVPAGDVVFTASGGSIGPFRYVVFYNDTPAGDPLLSYFDRGSSITLLDTETFTVDVQATLLTAT